MVEGKMEEKEGEWKEGTGEKRAGRKENKDMTEGRRKR